MLAQGRAVHRVAQRELGEGAKVTVEVADIEAAFLVGQTHADPLGAPFEQQPDGVGQLDLAALARWRLGQRVEDRRAEHIAGRHGQVARRLVDRRLLDQIVQLEDRAHGTAWPAMP